MSRAALALLLSLLAAAVLAVPASATIPAPSLTVDTAFAPTTGVASYDFTSGTASDVPNGVATDGDRIYAVGEVRDATGDANIGILARHADGTIDTSFSGDGKMVIPIAANTGRDFGASIVVLPNHHLRVLGGTDVDPSSGTNLDVAIVGLLPDGSPDPTFGAGTGLVTFPIGTSDDTPNRMVADASGRLAIAGATKTGGTDDAFVSLRQPDGSPAPGFGTAGVRVLNRAGGTLNDRAIDVAFRPGGGLVAVLQIATNATTNAYVTALHAFREDTGADDPSFAGTGDLVLPVGQPDTVPGAVIAYGDRLYVTGSTKVGADTDAFLARVDANGGSLESRRFDMRGAAAPDTTQAVTSQGLDLTVAPGATPTLVVVGSLTTSSGTGWASAAFNDLGGSLANAGYGDVVLPNPGQGALIGVAPLADDTLAVAGSILNTSSLDTSFGQAKLKVDADKACDLALTVPRPLELTVKGDAPGTVDLSVANAGTKACGGTITAPKHYALSAAGVSAPLTVAPLAAGASRTIKGAKLRYTGPRRAEDTVRFTLAAPADATKTNNVASLHVVYAYCDLGLRASKAGSAPTEGTRRYRFVLRNRGTDTCRGVGVGVAEGGRRASGERGFSLDAGRSATTSILASLRRGGKVGARRAITFTVRAKSQVNAANDRVTLHPRLVRVGDSRIGGAGARGVSGSATGGKGRLSRRALAVRSVQVAIHRLGGKRCSWIASLAGRTRSFKASKHACTRKVWMTAAGGRSWRLSLQRSLPRGRYEAYSRAVIGAGFAEGRFSRADGNLVRFRVG